MRRACLQRHRGLARACGDRRGRAQPGQHGEVPRASPAHLCFPLPLHLFPLLERGATFPPQCPPIGVEPQGGVCGLQVVAPAHSSPEGGSPDEEIRLMVASQVPATPSRVLWTVNHQQGPLSQGHTGVMVTQAGWWGPSLTDLGGGRTHFWGGGCGAHAEGPGGCLQGTPPAHPSPLQGLGSRELPVAGGEGNGTCFGEAFSVNGPVTLPPASGAVGRKAANRRGAAVRWRRPPPSQGCAWGSPSPRLLTPPQGCPSLCILRHPFKGNTADLNHN